MVVAPGATGAMVWRGAGGPGGRGAAHNIRPGTTDSRRRGQGLLNQPLLESLQSFVSPKNYIYYIITLLFKLQTTKKFCFSYFYFTFLKMFQIYVFILCQICKRTIYWALVFGLDLKYLNI